MTSRKMALVVNRLKFYQYRHFMLPSFEKYIKLVVVLTALFANALIFGQKKDSADVHLKEIKQIRTLIYEHKYLEARPKVKVFMSKAKEQKNDSLLMLAYKWSGDCEANLGNYKRALDDFLIGYKIALKRRDEILQDQFHWSMGIMYAQAGNYSKSIIYQRRSMSYAIKMNSAFHLASIKSNLGRTHKLSGNLNLVRPLYHDAKKVFESLNDSFLPTVYINYMGFYNASEQLDSAQFYFDKTKKFEKSLLPYQRNLRNLVRAETLFQLGGSRNFKEAVAHIDSVRLNDESVLFRIRYYNLKSQLLDGLNRKEEAIKVKDLAEQSQDSVARMNEEISFDESKALTDLFVTDAELSKKTADLKKVELQKEKQHLWLLLIILGGILLVSTIYLILLNLKKEIRIKENLIIYETAQRKKLGQDLILKKQELTNNLMVNFSQKDALMRYARRTNDEKLSNLINDIFKADSFEQFRNRFTEVYPSFFTRFMKKFPELTTKDLDLLALIHLRLSSKEISPLLNISLQGVEKARYRLRKKLDIQDRENLYNVISNIQLT